MAAAPKGCYSIFQAGRDGRTLCAAPNCTVDLRQLRYFIAVAQAGNFRRAAAGLEITQPPLSRQIMALERALGARLIDRRHQPLRLTPAGALLLQRACAIVAELERAKTEVQALAGRCSRPVGS